MKSIVIQKPNELVIEDRNMGEPKSGELRVKVKLAGICGSDSYIYRGHNPFAKYPRVIGHEFFGMIDAVGEGIDRERIGQRVAIDPVVSCGHCYPCSINRPNVCTTLSVIGVHQDGGFSEYCVVPEKNAYFIPETIPDESAVMIEPFTIAANVTSQLNPTAQDIAVIYGAGPIGLTCTQVLKYVYGVKQVIVVDRISERLTMASRSGADLTIDNSVDSLKETLEKLNIRPTVIIDSACHPAILQEAISIVSAAGRISIMGFSSEPSTIVQQGIISKQLTIFSSRLNAYKFPVVIDWLNKGLIKPDKLVTHQFDYQQIITALETFEKDPAHCCKILLTFN